MSDDVRRLRAALARIGELARSAANGAEATDDTDEAEPHDGPEAGSAPRLVCTPKSLPKRLLVQAAATARTINPVNAPLLAGVAGVAAGLIGDPLRIAVVTAKYWGPKPRQFSVSFMESTPADLRRRIVDHMNAWSSVAGVSFAETHGVGEVRISRGSGGYWSYLGTDILHIPKNRQTMNLEAFTMSTPDSEYKRVVRHETGHTLGFPHEHMRKALVARIDPDKAYAYFLRTQGWDKAMVDAQVLTPLDEATIMSTPADQTSIMCYQLPGSITRDGKPILGGTDIDPTDYTFAAKIYPKPGHDHGSEAAAAADDWLESEDVPVDV